MIALVAAVAKNGVIGSENKLVWRNKDDAKHFQALTTGKTVLMGRKTFESIWGYSKGPLPNRTSVVITSNKEYKLPANVEMKNGTHVVVETDIKTALRNHGVNDIFVIGGGQVYAQTIDLADRLYITHIDRELEGDTRFPTIDPKKWRKVSDEPHEGFSFVTYKRN